MSTKQLPKTDAERIKALQMAMLLASKPAGQKMSLPSDVAKYIHPFLVKLQNNIHTPQQVMNGTQEVNDQSLRYLIDELLLDIWEEIECAFDEMDPYSFNEQAKEIGVFYSYTESEKDARNFRLVA